MLETIRTLNPNLTFYTVNDTVFERYGVVLDSKPFESILNVLKNETLIPKEGNHYEAHHEPLYHASNDNPVVHDIFGSISLQFGYVNGHNSKLNAMEYHKSSEINVIATPCILFLAHYEDIHEHGLNVNSIQAFFVEEGTVIELHPLTLHFSPCKVDQSGFKCGVILPYGTNMEFVKPQGHSGKNNHYLFKTNKWLLNHPEHVRLKDLGAVDGLIGHNLEVLI